MNILGFLFKTKRKSRTTTHPNREEIDDEMLDQVTGGVHGYSIGKRP